MAAIATALKNGAVDAALDDLRHLNNASVDPAEVDYLYGVAYLQKHDALNARKHLERCRGERSADPDLLYHLALAYQMGPQRRPGEAAACFVAALQNKPDFFAAAFEFGMLKKDAGELEVALACFVNIANIVADQERLEEAKLAINEALLLAPDSPELLVFLGRLLLATGDLEEAAAAFGRTRDLAPDNPDLHNELGLVYYKLGRDDDALKCYKSALKLQPVFPQVRNNLGNLHSRAGRTSEAVKNYHYAVAQLSGYTDAWFNLSKDLLVHGEADEALAACERAIETSPGFALAHAYRADLLLTRGRYGEAWREFEWRVLADTGRAYVEDPRTADALATRPSRLDVRALLGTTILVVAEATLGDELFFLRFLPQLRAFGIDAHYRPSAKMRPLLESCAAGLTLFPDGGDASIYSAVLAVGDLPLVLGHRDDSAIPAPFPLIPPDDVVTEMAVVLGELGAGPALAITWRAGLASDAAMRKQIALADVAALIATWEGPVVAVQRAPAPGEIEAIEKLAGTPVHDFCALNEDLVQMAALLHVADDYVGVSNTNMHVMASLGNAARVLVKSPGEWRWRDEGDSTPWMPRARLYREDRRQGWTPALKMLGRDLRTNGAPFAE